MKREKIFVVAGARPNFIKIAPIIRELRARNDFQSVLVHTGQHFDHEMSAVFFEQLRIPTPDVHLGTGGGSHAQQTARVLEAVEQLLIPEVADTAGLLVVGDVNSTMAAALAAVKVGVRVAHVEAGLRSFDRKMPEEINRIVTDAISDLLMITEESARANLLHEGIPEERIVMTGNVMIDTLMEELPRARATDAPARLGMKPRGFCFVTLHRPSNVDEAATLRRIVHVLIELAAIIPVVFAVHPRTADRLRRFELLEQLEGARNIKLTAPLGYHESIAMIAGAAMVLSDSGGIQEETAVLDTPCLTLRDTTERPVTVQLGTSTLIGARIEAVLELARDILADTYKRGHPIPMWDGRAAARIVDALAANWGSKEETS